MIHDLGSIYWIIGWTLLGAFAAGYNLDQLVKTKKSFHAYVAVLWILVACLNAVSLLLVHLDLAIAK